MRDTKNCLQCEIDYNPDNSNAESEEEFCSVECQEAHEEEQGESKL